MERGSGYTNAYLEVLLDGSDEVVADAEALVV